MIAVAVDTSCGASLAIARAGELLLAAALPGRQREADRDLAPWLQRGLAQAGVEVTAVQRWTVGVGPGSFSGIRSGIALVRGICAVTGAAYRGVPSSVALALQLAEQVTGDAVIGVLHDARCGQVILSRYRWSGGQVQGLGSPTVESPADLARAELACARYVTVHGDVLLPLLPECVGQVTTAVAGLEARYLLAAAGGAWPTERAAVAASLEPVYVRPPVFVAPRAPSGGGAP
jgi:tRNA threonylcarbamoyl adenosine modification protein YeaZ